MKLKSITIYKVDIPMVEVFTQAFGNISRRPTVLVRAETADGMIGWGEAASLPFPLYKPETVDISMLVLKDYIAPLVLNREIESIEALNDLMRPIRGNHLAKAGLETAVWAIESQKSGKSISAMLGGKRNKVGVGDSIGIKNSIEETLDIISLRLSEGYQRIKIKIRPGWDIKLVKAVRKEFPDIPLMVDANSAYTLKDIHLLKKLDSYHLMMIEQPLGDDDIIDHSVLQKQIKTPICLDESINTVEDARKAIQIGACQIINIKLGRVGGLLESKKIHDLCKKNKIGVWIGGLLELGIGRVFLTAAASLPNCIYPADLSPTSFYYIDSIIDDSLEVDKNGYINVPDKPGLGVQINERKIKKYTTDKLIIS